jgi:hypothetical protein
MDYGMTPAYCFVANENVPKIRTLNQGKNIEILARE